MAGTRFKRAQDPGRTGIEELRFDFSAEEIPAEDDGDEPVVTAGEAPGTRAFGEAAPAPEAPSPLLSVVAPSGAGNLSLVGPGAVLAGTASDAALSIGDFYARVRGALREAFPEEIWVTGEICKVTTSRGHRYLELADHLDATAQPYPAGAQSFRNGPVRNGAATLEVACWARDWPVVHYELEAVGVELVPGLVVRVRGKVSVWEGGSKLRFSMTALDVEALVGGIAAARRRLLGALAAEGLLESNRRLALVPVPLRVGLVTSPGSEAYGDFTGQLERSGYRFQVRFEPSSVQGPEAPAQIAAALARLGAWGPDVAVVVRGGGAKGDLVAFDSELVARAIAGAGSPVWTGIGHTGDRSVADEVAHQALVTPTQCGEALVAVVAAYLDGVDRRARLLAQRVEGRLKEASRELTACSGAICKGVRQGLERSGVELRAGEARVGRAALVTIERSHGRLAGRAQRLLGPTSQQLAAQAQLVAHKRELLQLLEPSHQLRRGWSLTRDETGAVVRSSAGLRGGSRLVTTFAEGSAVSVVDEVRLPAAPDEPVPGDGQPAQEGAP
jgi:exodeoxyribonuclease VII large subunit